MTNSYELVRSPYRSTQPATGEVLLSGTFDHDTAVEDGGARLAFKLHGGLTFSYSAGTMTQSEAREKVLRLAELLDARHQCLLILGSAPAEVMPYVLPQLKDLVEYEVRMAQVRREVQGPDIRERIVYLPAVR